MGNQTSTANTISNVLNTATTDILMQNSSNCAQNNSQTQSLTLGDINAIGCSVNISNISQKASQTPNFTCSSNNNNNNSIMTQLQTAIKQHAKAAVSGIPGAINSQAVSNSISKIQNAVNTNVNISNLSNCVQNNFQSQKLNTGKINVICPQFCNTGCQQGYNCDMTLCAVNENNISQLATQTAVGKCLQKNVALNSAISSVANTLSQSSSAANTGINLANLLGFGGLGNLGEYGIICSIVLIIIILICVAFSFS